MSSSQKQGKRRSTSTARRLNIVWVFRLLGIFITVDIAFVCILIFGFFYSTQKKEFGEATLNRWYISGTSDPVKNAENVLSEKEKELLHGDRYISFECYHPENDGNAISVVYNETDKSVLLIVKKDMQFTVSDMTTAVSTMRIVFTGVLILEALLLLSNILFGVFAIRRKLKSLDQMAFIASELGSRAGQKDDDELFSFDEQKVHNLEDAIARITPDGPDCVLHTSDAELKGLEIAINGLLERMQAAYKQQSRFVSDASHELRTPIAVIQGYVNMLDRWGKKDEKVLEESIDAIKHESEHMKKLVEQLLFLARGDSGRNKFVLEQVNLNEIVKEVYEESLMIDEKHIYHSELTDQAEIVYADVSMLKQAVRILVENAAKYTPEHDQIRIGCGMSEQHIPYLYVQDNGIGMKSEEVSHAFERFYRADNARDSKTGGTGLGLSIAKWIVDRHSGYFKVLSYEDIGTRISICLPQETVKKEWENTQKFVG